MPAIMDGMNGFVVHRDQLKFLKTLSGRPILMNTFWGFDSPQALPPNFVVTGPISKKQSAKTLPEIEEAIKAKDPELLEWMMSSEEKIVYVSIGSEATW